MGRRARESTRKPTLSRIAAFEDVGAGYIQLPGAQGWCSETLIIANLGLRKETKKIFFGSLKIESSGSTLCSQVTPEAVREPEHVIL